MLHTTATENKHRGSSDDDEPKQADVPSSSDDASQSDDGDSHVARLWREVGKVIPLNLQTEQNVVRAGNKPALAKFAFSRDVASEVWRSSFPEMKNYRELSPEEAAVGTIRVMSAVGNFGYNNETADFDKEQAISLQSFFGAPYQDGLQVIDENPDAGKWRQHSHKWTIKNKVTGTNIDLAYMPNANRMLGIASLIFACAGELFFGGEAKRCTAATKMGCSYMAESSILRGGSIQDAPECK